MNRAYLVTGGESCGTRMMVRSFVLVDLPEWDRWTEVDDWPYGGLVGKPAMDFVMHAGVPFGGRWPNFWEIAKRLRHDSHRVIPVVMVRDWNAAAQSQVRRGFVGNIREAEENLRAAYRRITQQLAGYIMVSYEQFCLEPGYRRHLFEDRFGLPDPPIDIHYANPQYYGGGMVE